MLQHTNCQARLESDTKSSDMTSEDVTSDDTDHEPFDKFRWFTVALYAASTGPRRLSPAEWRVLSVAWDRSRGKDGRSIFMILRTYMRRADVSEKTARRALHRLCDLGYLRLEKRGGNRPGDGGDPAPSRYSLRADLVREVGRLPRSW